MAKQKLYRVLFGNLVVWYGKAIDSSTAIRRARAFNSFIKNPQDIKVECLHA